MRIDKKGRQTSHAKARDRGGGERLAIVGRETPVWPQMSSLPA